MSTQPPRTRSLRNDPRGLGILLVLLVTIGGACETTTEKARVDATPTAASQVTAANATNTPKPANTAKPTNTPKPTSSPKAAEAATPATAAAVQPTATAPAPASNQPTAVPPTIAPAPTATSAIVGNGLPGCYVAGQDKCNCSHFATQAYAQWFHNNYDQADVNKLDNNNDGVVCEGNR